MTNLLQSKGHFWVFQYKVTFYKNKYITKKKKYMTRQQLWHT